MYLWGENENITMKKDWGKGNEEQKTGNIRKIEMKRKKDRDNQEIKERGIFLKSTNLQKFAKIGGNLNTGNMLFPGKNAFSIL